MRATIGLCLVCVAFGCGGDDSPNLDAGGGLDAGPGDAGQDARRDAARRDAGSDAALPFDAGPPVTGCELWEDADAGSLDAGSSDGSLDGGAADDAGLGPLPPDAPPLAGPGGPSRTFRGDELRVACAALDGGERDRDHHNTVRMLDGYLWMPWAHEAGVGGLSVFELSDPCAPVPVATTVAETMRETHAAGVAYLSGRRWMVTTSLTGILLWDISDPAAPRVVTDMSLPNVTYPDSYARVVMSTFWQAPYIYVGASDNGVFIVDASDPEAPSLVGQFEPIPAFRVGGVHAIGTTLVVFASEGARTQLFDVSDPTDPRPIPGGSWTLTDGGTDRLGRPNNRSAYFAHTNGGRAYYARHFLGGGLIIYDFHDPHAPRFLGAWTSPDLGANGGYVFIQGDEAFVGMSRFGEVIDIADPTNPTRLARIDMTGDLDMMVPVGNVIVASVDDDAVPGEASLVYPWKEVPDSVAPRVNFVAPRDGEEDVALGARVGVTFDEYIDLQTVHPGSFYLRPIDEGGAPLGPPVDALYSGQEGVYNLTPRRPLRPGTRYEVVVPAGGARDWSGNPTEAEFRSTFRTVSCE